MKTRQKNTKCYISLLIYMTEACKFLKAGVFWEMVGSGCLPDE